LRFLPGQYHKKSFGVQEHAVLISRNAQCQRLLIDLSLLRKKKSNLSLPMPHRDIADYLDLKLKP
jgi:hypothetical protein